MIAPRLLMATVALQHLRLQMLMIVAIRQQRLQQVITKESAFALDVNAIVRLKTVPTICVGVVVSSQECPIFAQDISNRYGSIDCFMLAITLLLNLRPSFYCFVRSMQLMRPEYRR